MKKAKWIKAPYDFTESLPAFVKSVVLEKEVKDAVLSVATIGMFAVFINGNRVGDEVLSPGWTSFEKRTQKIRFSVADMLEQENELKIIVGKGFAKSRMGWGRQKNNPDKHVSLIYCLEVTYSDGTTDVFCSDTETKVYSSKILFSEIYDGETVDNSAEIQCVGNALLDEIHVDIVDRCGEKIIEQEIIYPVEIICTPKGETVIDFGQNLTGYVEVTVSANTGDEIVLNHGEVLDKNGNFYNENYGSAKAEAKYISGGGAEIFKPLFTYYGFRYVLVKKFPAPVTAQHFKAIVVHSDMKRTSGFVCGNSKINQLYHNIIWGQKSNYLDVPTDCPQRDERLGWTGDAQVFVRIAAINFDVYTFFSKWLGDMILDQRENGMVPNIIPDINCDEDAVSSAWGDAAVICPWEIYRAYGKPEILEQCYPMMKKWVDYIRDQGDNAYLWLNCNAHFGDWLALDGINEKNERHNFEDEIELDGDTIKGATDHDLIASCYYAYSTSLLVKAGEVLGKDMQEYCVLEQNIKKAIRERFIAEDVPICKTQTACAMLICFDIHPSKKTGELLQSLVTENGNKLKTGFVGTPLLLHALTKSGYNAVAYDLLMQEEFPSWLYSVNRGATTMWEHWDGVNEKGDMWSKTMNSFNHYAYGAVGDWIFGECAGIQPASPGYQSIRLCPKCDRRLGFLKAHIDTPHGRVVSAWYYKENRIYFEFEIPQNVSATLLLPDGETFALKGGKYHFTTADF